MVRMVLPIMLALAVAFPSGSALAQANGKSTKVVLYKDRLAAQWDTVNCVKNVLKFNPLLFFRGEVPIYYEHALSHRISAELAVGITTRNYLGGEFTGDEPDDFSAGTKLIPKISAHVGFRLYLIDDIEPQGTYVQGEFAYLNHSKDIAMKDSTGRVTDQTLRDQSIYNDIRVYFGYQRLSSTSNWLFDAYCGAAFRNRSITQVDERLDLVERTWSYTVVESHDNVPAFFLGVKIGYGF
ncbi:MAG: hypothetical protein K8H89_14305 [Flavobacteriales bacterium]|nr:hypothetical protein [Flavobacteriales bacterium]MCB0757819.1 hypothetical protein [Flavobacteriales bacterium]